MVWVLPDGLGYCPWSGATIGSADDAVWELTYGLGSSCLLWARWRRVLGGVTGLDDVDVLPDLYTHEESRKTKELLLMTCLSLMRLDGLRLRRCPPHAQSSWTVFGKTRAKGSK